MMKHLITLERSLDLNWNTYSSETSHEELQFTNILHGSYLSWCIRNIMEYLIYMNLNMISAAIGVATSQ